MLLQSLQRSGLDENLLLPLARQIFQALCDPTSLFDLLRLITAHREPKPTDSMLLSIDSVLGEPDWKQYVSALSTAIKPFLSEATLGDLQHAVITWRDEMETTVRFDALV